jgi:hypothetical protein
MKKLLFLAPLVLSACASEVLDVDRGLLYQTKGAAEEIIKFSSKDEIAVIATDIRDNVDTLLGAWGMPEDPKPYSLDASKKLREQHQRDHSSSGWLWGVIGIALPALAWAAKRLMSGPVGLVADVLVGGISEIRKKAEASPDKKISVEDLLGILTAKQEDANVREFVKSMVKKVEQKSETKKEG